ncbi:MAG TPA: zinc-dependent alcohol dehydrogenase family protein [Capillimicrobium sp.]|jgi:2-desacetyl-2-hydroxyethyl bacteriochlorophyllide A dehydrogenase
MKAVLLSEPGSFSIERLDDPAPAPDGIVVAPDGCGICGTDVHIIDGEFEGTRYPIVPGHEFSGEIVAVGREVSDLRVGDVVAVEPSLFCGHCHYCRIGRGNLCTNYNSIGVGRENGGCAELVAVPATQAFVLHEGFRRDWGALIEPVSCAIHGFDQLSLRIADHVLIYGAGTMGLMLCQLAAHHAAGSVSVVDVNADRLPRARALGADHVATSADELDRPEGWEVVIDATGAVPAIQDGLRRVRRAGTFLMFGVAPKDATATFSPFRVYHDEISIIGSMAILHSFERAREVVAAGIIDGDTLITHRMGLDDYEDAIAAFRAGEGLKIQITPSA